MAMQTSSRWVAINSGFILSWISYPCCRSCGGSLYMRMCTYFTSCFIPPRAVLRCLFAFEVGTRQGQAQAQAHALRSLRPLKGGEAVILNRN